ncbi:exported hypothetical protein [Candidatus Desulfosporosinus infrequens]|uniref:Uncharacterized protein n=1 Tax=Candidatus Desulfosporosinus infrequens TaxID=2043169 RepID=A0A2U3LMD1_9FIRM|nr:exported hypothetical protein [Candidatus Desulfosporosinus infrequens]
MFLTILPKRWNKLSFKKWFKILIKSLTGYSIDPSSATAKPTAYVRGLCSNGTEIPVTQPIIYQKISNPSQKTSASNETII